MPIKPSHPSILTERRETVWRNPTRQTLKFRLVVAAAGAVVVDGSSKNSAYRYLDVEVPPGEEVTLDSQFDQAIQRVVDGQIVSGLCPQLINTSTPTPPRVARVLLPPEALPRVRHERRMV